MALNVVISAVLNGSRAIESAGESKPAHYPGSGYATLTIRMVK